MTRRSRAIALAATVPVLTGLPGPVAAHGLTGRLDASLPLGVYLAGAAIAVALTFAIAFAYSGRWRPAPAPPIRHLPRPILLLLRVLGLLAWAWVVAQFVAGGSSDAEVGSLFTWVYGWVGLAIVSALLGPVWEWLDPFATLHDSGAWMLRRLRITGRASTPYPARIAAWPAAVGFAAFVWLELAYQAADMDAVVVAYTIVALVGMAWFGRDRWRSGGEVFTVWFGLLNRVGRYVLAGPTSSGRVKRQHFPDGLLGRPWDASLVALVAVATGAILYDGLSQTQLFFEAFGLPGLAESTILLAGFLAIIVSVVLLVGRRVGMVAMGAGLVPISVGYLIAHYLTYLLGEGQRIVVAVSDPFQQGWDLFGTAFFEPSTAWIPSSIIWSVMFLAVVGGHVLGAWAGHLRTTPVSRSDVHRRRAQLPLAGIMIVLTTLTLWSLGQVVFQAEPPDETGAIPARSSTPAPSPADPTRP